MAAYAFIDGQNLHLSARRLGWAIDYGKFRAYLRAEYGVTRALYFLGFRATEGRLYERLQQAGFELRFREIAWRPDGSAKGNCDSDLICAAWELESEYATAVIVSSDGDFAPLVRLLKQRGKLKGVVGGAAESIARSLRREAGDYLSTLDQLERRIRYTPRA